MAEQQPPPLNYQGADSRPPVVRANGKRKFLLALVLGTAISAIVWFGEWKGSTEQGTAVLLIGWPALKIITACVMLFFPNWRSFAAGLFASLALGALIFFGLCTWQIFR